MILWINYLNYSPSFKEGLEVVKMISNSHETPMEES